MEQSRVVNENLTMTCSNISLSGSNIKSLHRPANYLKSLYGETYIQEIHPGRILADPHYNKSTAFTLEEREDLLLKGLLPPAVETIETQARRAYKQLKRFTVPISQHIYLVSLRERNITLFYRLLLDHLEELMPLIYTPTVGEACLKYGTEFRSSEGMYLTINDLRDVKRVMMNWKPNILDEVAIIVLTDGSRILGLGDLGSSGMGIPVGKLALYVAAGGFHPSTTLPVLIDVGTNCEALLNDEFYLGLKHRRVDDQQFYQLMDEFLDAVKERWPNAVVQFEDFSNNHCFAMLDRYRNNYLCFNDDIQGTGAVIAAGFLNALKIAKLQPTECRIVLCGAGAAGIGVVKQIVDVLVLQHNLTYEACLSMFYLIDSKGLVTSDRVDGLQKSKEPFARKDIKAAQLEKLNFLQVMQLIKPTALIGLSGQPGQFSQSILEYVASINERPIIFPLSNPTSKSECTFEEAYSATNGKVIFASGSPFSPVKNNGVEHVPSQGNNLYTFPGLGLGAWLSQAEKITDTMVTEATIALANCTTEDHLNKNLLYPPLQDIRNISIKIASAVMKKAHSEGLSRLEKQPIDYEAYIKENQYQPSYVSDSFECKNLKSK